MKNGIFRQETFVAGSEIRIFLYFQDLASFHRKKNHGNISISRGFIFFRL